MTPPRGSYSAQARKVLGALPGTIPEISDATGYPYDKVRAFIAELRVNGVNVTAFPDPAQQTVFDVVPERTSLVPHG